MIESVFDSYFNHMKDITIIAGRSEHQYWRDLWHYRELFYFMAWRDILVRYKQTVVGVAWAVIRPVVTMFVLTFIFGRLAKMDSWGVPYPILVFCGMLPWNFFANAFADCGNSLVSNSGMISKVYFPRLVVPVSSVITSLVDFLISGLLLALIMIYYKYTPSPMVAFLPIFVALAFTTALGAGLWVSALMVHFRDFRYIVPFVVQFGLYISPVAFVSRAVPEDWRLLYSINPMVGVIDGFRWSILGQQDLDWVRVCVSAIMSLTILTSGILYFRRTERVLADVI